MAAIDNLLKADVEPSAGRSDYRRGRCRGRGFCGTAGVLQRLRVLCDAHGILLIDDEIQAGAHAAGMLRSRHSGVVPGSDHAGQVVAGDFRFRRVVGADIMDSVGPGGLAALRRQPLACGGACRTRYLWKKGIFAGVWRWAAVSIARLDAMAQRA